MKITEKEVEYAAKLANLEVPADERRELAEQLDRIVSYVEQLSALDVTGIEPTPQVVTFVKNVERDDRVAPRVGSGDAGKTVKLFKVPKVITER